MLQDSHWRLSDLPALRCRSRGTTDGLCQITTVSTRWLLYLCAAPPHVASLVGLIAEAGAACARSNVGSGNGCMKRLSVPPFRDPCVVPFASMHMSELFHACGSSPQNVVPCVRACVCGVYVCVVCVCGVWVVVKGGREQVREEGRESMSTPLSPPLDSPRTFVRCDCQLCRLNKDNAFISAAMVPQNVQARQAVFVIHKLTSQSSPGDPSSLIRAKSRGNAPLCSLRS